MKRAFFCILLSFVILAFAATLAFSQGKAIELKHFNWRPEDFEKWGKIYDEFMKTNPDIKLIDDPIPADKYFNNLEINLEGKQADPIVSIWQNRVWNNQMFKRGYLVDLTTLLPEFKKVPPHHQYNFMTNEGKAFAAPVSAQYTGMLYNKKIFRENGVTPPVTWDEFIALCQKLKGAGVTPLMFQVKDAWHIHYGFDLMMKPFLGGPSFINALKSGKYDFTNPKFVDALKRLKSLEPYFPKNYTGLGYSDAQNMIATEQVAIWPGCGSWEVFTLKDINPEVELGVFATPVAKKGDPAYVTVFTDQGLAIASSATDAQKKAALRFLKWMTTPQAGLLVNKHIGFFNTWDNNVFDDVALKEYAALAGKKGELIMSDWAILLSDGSPTATELIQAGIQELMAGTKTAEQVAQGIKTGLSVWYGK